MRTQSGFVWFGTLLVALAVTPRGFAAEAPPVSRHMAARAAETWLEVLRAEDFSAADGAEVTGVRPLMAEKQVVGWIAELDPEGYILLAASSAFSPVKAFSLSHGFDDSEYGPGEFFRDEMVSERQALAAERRDGASLGEQAHEQWLPLLEARVEAVSKSTKSTRVGPLVTARWGQFSPYADFCPATCRGPSVVGCVATAISQLVFFWKHPEHGFGTHLYYWSGDGCQNFGRELFADFSDPYDWSSMVDEVFPESPFAARRAIAELCYEVGISIESNFGYTGTGALVADAVTALPTFFGYNASVNRIWRRDLASDQEWFEVFKDQLDLGRPVLLALRGWEESAPTEVIQHAVVADGYWDNWPFYVHFNLGWSHFYDDWYLLESIVTASIHWDVLDQQFAIRDIFPDSCMVPPRPGAPQPAVATATAAETYRISWQDLQDAAVYEFQEDIDPSFSSPSTTRTSGLFHLFEHAVEAPTVFYYRVRGSGICGFNELPSEWSAVASVTVLPTIIPEPEADYRQIVAGVARTSGAAGSAWHTTLTVVNRSTETVDAVLYFPNTAAKLAAAVSLEPGRLRLWEDAVVDLWGIQEPVAGAVDVRSTGPLIVTARTYNRSGDGTYGQYLPGCSEGDVIGAGATATLAPVRAGSRWRTNIGFVHFGEEPCLVGISLFGPDGGPRGQVIEVEVAAGGWTQVNNVAVEAGVGEFDQGYATFTPLNDGCAVWGYASLIDNVTGDPTTIPMATISHTAGNPETP